MSFGNIIGLIGYILSAAAYLLHIPEAKNNTNVVIGMIIITLGYLALAAAKIIGLIIQEKEHFEKKNDDVTKLKEWTLTTKENKNIIAWFGNLLLLIFFAGIFIYPQMTFHVRFYDAFAAIGYGLYVLSTWIHSIPMYIVALPLVMYYFFGMSLKFNEEGWISKVQLIARFLLVIYYSMMPFSFAH